MFRFKKCTKGFQHLKPQFFLIIIEVDLSLGMNHSSITINFNNIVIK